MRIARIDGSIIKIIIRSPIRAGKEAKKNKTGRKKKEDKKNPEVTTNKSSAIGKPVSFVREK